MTEIELLCSRISSYGYALSGCQKGWLWWRHWSVAVVKDRVGQETFSGYTAQHRDLIQALYLLLDKLPEESGLA